MSILERIINHFRPDPEPEFNEEAIVESLGREDSFEKVIRHFDGEEMPRDQWPEEIDNEAA